MANRVPEDVGHDCAGEVTFLLALFHDHINALAACAVSSRLVRTKSACGITNVQTRGVTTRRRRPPVRRVPAAS
jgi:hypothetical protein